MPLISIVVPVYKSEQFLSRCIEGILNQSVADFELILVDDGSPDNSGEICDKYAEKDSRVRVIHQENKGAASARNAGIKASSGEFLAFCDSDDFVSTEWLHRLLSVAAKDTLAIGGYCIREGELGQVKEIGLEPGRKYSNKEYYRFKRAGVAGFLWNALYDRSIVIENGIYLRENKKAGDYNEDLIFATVYVQCISQIVYTGYSDYYYNVHDDSLSRDKQNCYFEKYAEKYRIWEEYLQNNNSGEEELYRDLAADTLYHFISALRQIDGFKELKRIIASPEMEKCITLADTSRENQLEMKLIRNKRMVFLFCFYKLLKLKEKIT